MNTLGEGSIWSFCLDKVNPKAKTVRILRDEIKERDIHIMDDGTFRVFHRFVSPAGKPRFATGLVNGSNDQELCEIAEKLILYAGAMFFHEDGTSGESYIHVQ